jgi:predicted nucleic-acid-binding protein
MIGVDTNLLLRLILDDDPKQSPVVERILAEAEDGGIFVSLIVVAELAWVPKRGYRETPDQILEIVGSLLDAREFSVERAELVRGALDDARSARCGVADALIARINSDAGAALTLTFDLKAKRLPTMQDAASPS